VAETLIPFIIVFFLSVSVFVWSCDRRFGLLELGRADQRLDHVGQRLQNMFYYAIFQRRVAGRKFGFNHVVLFWGFLVLLIANAEFLLGGLFPDIISLSLLPDGAFRVLGSIFDVVSVIVLAAVLVAVLRRLFFPPSYIDANSRDAFVILGMVSLLMIAYFGLHAAEMRLLLLEGHTGPLPYLISGWAARAFLIEVSALRLEQYVLYYWWVHAVTLLAFLNYLPYSKHMHVLTAVPNCFFKSLEKVNTQPREDFTTSENGFGAGDVTGFPWKGLFDSFSCTECGRCADVCPATSTGKPLNPRLLIHDIKASLLRNASQFKAQREPEQPLIGDSGEEGTIQPDAIWACTTCGHCMEVCPVFIEHVPRIVDLRRHLVEMKAEFPPELNLLFENMESRSNPWGMAPPERTKWTQDLDVKPFQAGQTEYLFYVGCAGGFDARARQVTQSTAKILDRAGISWGILGKDELCCGDSLRRLGNEYVFEVMALANVEMLREKGVTKVITQCPHCFSALLNDYAQYGLEIDVIHHTELIEDLIAEGKLPLEDGVDLGRVVCHDSCYLGRYNEVYAPPREVLSAVTGSAPLEMQRNRQNSFCCGAGGGRMWLEESLGTRIDKARVDQALEVKPDTIAVACPYCMTMFEDGLKDKNVEGVNVRDIAEIVADSLK